MKNEKLQWKKWNWLLYGFLGFLCPPLGFILFVYYNIKNPKIAKSAGIGALIPIILIIAYTFLTEFSNFFEDLFGGLAFLLLGLSGFGG